MRKLIVERIVGHVLLLGVGLGALLGEFAIVVYLVREFTTAPLIGQWPPGKPWQVWLHPTTRKIYHGPGYGRERVTVTQMDRVDDMRADLIECFLGWSVGLSIFDRVTIDLIRGWLA